MRDVVFFQSRNDFDGKFLSWSKKHSVFLVLKTCFLYNSHNLLLSQFDEFQGLRVI